MKNVGIAAVLALVVAPLVVQAGPTPVITSSGAIALVKSTPKLTIDTSVPATSAFDAKTHPYVQVKDVPKGGIIGGYLSVAYATEGVLSDGTTVLAIPLDSGGSGGIFTQIVFAHAKGASFAYAGHIDSAGHLGITVANGYVVARFPKYAPNDPNCCPSKFLIQTYNVIGGALHKVSEKTVPAAGADSNAAKTVGSAWSPALGAWLPNPDTGFVAWANGQSAVTNQYDYFVCGGARVPGVGKQNFDYPGSACPPVKNGTPFVYGTGEPIKGNVVYDRAHRIVLYNKGCCAWRGFALTANVGPPPKPVSNADLSGVHTMRGVSLGMTQGQVERIYGAARPHDTKGRPGVTTLSYTTMKTKPTEPGGDACGQFQSFSFRQDRLISIELLAGC